MNPFDAPADDGQPPAPSPAFAPPLSHVQFSSAMFTRQSQVTVLHWRLAPSGILTLDTLLDLEDAIEDILSTFTPDIPLFIDYDALYLQPLIAPYETKWLIVAGHIKKRLIEFKARGGLLITLVRQRLIGGPYLILGASSQIRAVYATTLIYPGLDATHYEETFKINYPFSTQADDALDSGLITHVLSSEQNLETSLIQWVLDHRL